MKTTSIIGLIFLSVFLMPFQMINAKSASTQAEKIVYVNTILDEVNKHRHSIGLPPLVINNFLSEEAHKHTLNMASEKIELGHDDYKNRFKRIYAHFLLSRAVSENVAHYKIPAKEVVNKWLQSPGHRKNIEGNYSITGISAIEDGVGGVYYTQIFARIDEPQSLG